VIHRAGEHTRQLGRAHAPFQRGELRLGLGDDRLVALGRSEFEQNGGVVQIARERLDRGDPLLYLGALARDGLRLLLVVPEAGGERERLEAIDFGFQPRKVKDAPLAP